MKWKIREIALFLSKFLSLSIMQNIAGLIALRNYLPEIKKTSFYQSREHLWAVVMSPFVEERILFLEFGVHKGYSIAEFAKLNCHPKSMFVGFDSFEGLPKDWRNFINVYKKNHFDTGGIEPKVEDSRVSFLKGWFNQTLPKFIADGNIKKFEKVVVHLDADIYSSTFYVLASLSQQMKSFTVIFDELPGEEARALYDFLDVFGGEYSFIGYSSKTHRFPMQVALQFER